MQELENLHENIDRLLVSQGKYLKELGYTGQETMFVDYSHFEFGQKVDYLSKLIDIYAHELQIKQRLLTIKHAFFRIGADYYSTKFNVSQREVYAYFENYDNLNERLSWCRLKFLPKDAFIITLTLDDIQHQENFGKCHLKDLLKLMVKDRIKKQDYILGYAAVVKANELYDEEELRL